MRKLIAFQLMSLDGIVESPNEWAFPYSDDEMERENAAGMAASDALLLGRATTRSSPPSVPLNRAARKWWTT